MTGFMEFLSLMFWKLAEGVGNAPTSARADPVFKTGAASLYLPAFRRVYDYDGGYQRTAARKSSFANRKLKLAARVGLAPTPCGLTNRRATLTPPGNGAAGRTSTCIVPFRRRMPHVFGHDSNSN